MSRCTSDTLGARRLQVPPLPSGCSPREPFELMRIREAGTPSLGVLPPELLKEIFKKYVRIERARYLKQIGAPRGEYSIRDYIQEYGQPVQSFMGIMWLYLPKRELTSLDGLELIENPDRFTLCR